MQNKLEQFSVKAQFEVSFRENGFELNLKLLTWNQ
jgi:hypothetical protein